MWMMMTRSMTKIEEELEVSELVIDKIHKTTGWDEDVIGCWYHNYQSPQCQTFHGTCKGLYQCQLLERNYTSKGDNNGIQ